MVIREHHVLGETQPCLECQREEDGKKVMELGTQLSDARAFRLNPNMITKTQAILGQKESGKTYCAGVLEEEMAEHGLPFVVIDAMGAHIGIKEKYPVVIFGGTWADVPISADLGRQVANAIVEENVSAVLDVSPMNKSEQRRFVADFCDELYAINASPRHVFVEECQEFAPQMVTSSTRAAFNAIDVMVRLGRQKGLGITMISQRAALINKNILSQAGTFWIFRTVWKADVETISDLVREVEGPELATVMRQNLPTQETGVAWVWSPTDLKICTEVRIRHRLTYHAGATPEMGEMLDLKLVSTDTAALAETFQKMMDDRKQEDDEIAQLKREVGTLQRQIDKQAAGEDLKALLRKAIAEDEPSSDGTISTKISEQLEFTTEELVDYKRQLADVTKRMERLDSDHRDCENNIQRVAELEEANRVLSQGGNMIGEAFRMLGISGSEPGNPIDEQAMTDRILARIGTTNQVTVIAPVEALREQFLNDAVDRIIEAVERVSPEAKRYLLFLIQLGEAMPANQLLEHVTGRKIPSGGGYQKELRYLRELEAVGVAEGRQGAGWIVTMTSLIWIKLRPYKPEKEDVEAVFDQVVAKLATEALP